MCKIQGANLPGITAVVVILATILPKQFNYLAPAADTIALILMQVYEALVSCICYGSLCIIFYSCLLMIITTTQNL